MNWAKLIIGLIEASLWPVVTLILAGGALVYFRKELTSLFRPVGFAPNTATWKS